MAQKEKVAKIVELDEKIKKLKYELNLISNVTDSEGLLRKLGVEYVPVASNKPFEITPADRAQLFASREKKVKRVRKRTRQCYEKNIKEKERKKWQNIQLKK